MITAGIYIHVPFCTIRCMYCDFYTVDLEENSVPEFVNAVIKEIEYCEIDTSGWRFDTIFIGGGTPSLLDSKSIDARIITPMFKDLHNGQYKFLSYYGKRARGLMARYLVQQKVETVKAIKAFAVDGYRYSEAESGDDTPVFLRNTPAAK